MTLSMRQSIMRDWHGPPGFDHRDSDVRGRTRADTTGGKSGRPYKGRPNFLDEVETLRDERDLERDRRREEQQDADDSRRYTGSTDSSGGTDA